MCCARHLLPAVIIRASVACLLTVTPTIAVAWGIFPTTENSDEFQAAPVNNARMVDPAVRQAGWNSPQASNSRSVSSNMASRGPQIQQSTAANRKGPLFGGKSVTFPSLPFGRAKSEKTKGSANNAVPGQSTPYLQNHMQQQAGGRRPMPLNGTAQRVTGNMGMPGSQSLRNPRTTSAASLQGTRQAMPPQPMPMPQGVSVAQRPPRPMPQSTMVPRQPAAPTQGAVPQRAGVQNSSVAPAPSAMQNIPVPFIRSVTPPMPNSATGGAPIHPTATMPHEPAALPMPVVTQTSMVANSPADKLVMKANELTTTAKTEADYTRIIETCRRARVSQPSPAATQYANDLAAWAYNRRGQLKAEAGRDTEAMLDFDDSIRADAKRWRALHNRGVLFAQSGEFEKAFDDFNRTIELSPNFAKAYCNRAALFMVADDLEAAGKDYARAIELDPNLSVAHRGRARACHLLGELDAAADHYDAAVQLAPNDAYAFCSRADLMTDMGRYADAAAGYDEAIRLQPNSAQAYSCSAWLLATCPDSSVRNPELAIERAKKAIELGGKEDAVGLDTLAAAQASAGQYDVAAQSVSKALAQAPAEERSVYQERLELYQHGKAFRIERVQQVSQASYESEEQGTGSGE